MKEIYRAEEGDYRVTVEVQSLTTGPDIDSVRVIVRNMRSGTTVPVGSLDDLGALTLVTCRSLVWAKRQLREEQHRKDFP